MSSILDILRDREILLCVGPGGVGKTTTSAAIGLAAARSGLKTAVLTIDPARRLADALGVTLDNTPRRIDPSVFDASHLEVPGELWALMLDPARTFDDLVERLAPNRSTADRLLNNVIYRQMTRALAGTLEYTAVEKLFDLRHRYDFDLVVVDTPPSKNVLDFIQAPEWISRFLDERVLKWLLLLDPNAPAGGFGRSLIKRTGRIVWEVLSKVFGKEFLGDLIEFIRAIESMTAEFRHRADSIQALLRSPKSTFLVVASTDHFVLRDAAYLRSEITRRGIPFAGFVVNRVHMQGGVIEPQQAAGIIRAAGADDPAAERLAFKLVGAWEELSRQSREDLEAVDKLRHEAGWSGFVGMLPLQVEEIHDLGALDRLAGYLTAPAAGASVSR